MVTIQIDSEAGQALAAMMQTQGTYKVTVQERTISGRPAVALKRNEDMWTPTLKVEEF